MTSNIMKKQAFENVVETLGQPFYRDERTALYHGDCVEIMSQLPRNSVDLTITSPPYNIGKAYEEILDVHKYIEWCVSWLKKIHDVTAHNGALALNVGYLEVPKKGHAVPIPYLLWDKTPFYLHQEIVWNYGAGVASRKRLSPRNEKVLWFLKDSDNYTFNLDPIRDPDVKYPNQKKNGKLKCNPLGKNPSDVWQIAKVTSGKNRSSQERAPHPAQFPLELINRLMKGFSNEEDIVLDPFLGSGTTAESSIINGRYVIGIEINKEYLLYAKNRLQRRKDDISLALAQQPLLV
ncbi:MULTISPECIES: DNA-methyltransferase [Aeromonas]|uniref:DNA-methyltransferase n=1 Tax=Aeromonas TaxID=642 RepID=UPI001F3EC930|nr:MULTISPECIES: site-specific DNA-methyltransferase [Aeromonas]MCF5913867.1 site-specific DNA-methyltransferase [Aeromonas veronii]